MSANLPPGLTPQLLQQIMEGPAVPPPPGVTPNFANPESIQPLIRAAAGFGLVIATLATAARIYTKAILLRQMHWEDYTAVVSWILYLGFVGTCFQAVPWVGIHMWDQRGSEISNLLYYANTAEIVYNPTIAFVKITVLLQYMRIFVPCRRHNAVMYFAIHIILWTTLIMYIIVMFLQIFSCHPREKQWNQLLPGTCFDVLAILVGSASFNFVSDIILLAMPQYSIWRLQMAGKRKAGVSAIFGLGGVAVIVTALRVQSTVQVRNNIDVSWYLAPTAIWAILEIALGIVCTALPVMPKFIGTMRGTISERLSWYRQTSTFSEKLSSYRQTSKISEKLSSRIPRSWPKFGNKRSPAGYVISAPVSAQSWHPAYYHSRSETPVETWYDDCTDCSVSELSAEPIKPLPALPFDQTDLEAQHSQMVANHIVRTVQIEVQEHRLSRPFCSPKSDSG